jgi:hypothetical protein
MGPKRNVGFYQPEVHSDCLVVPSGPPCGLAQNGGSSSSRWRAASSPPAGRP